MNINLFIKSYSIHSMLTVILLTVATTLTQLIETHSPPQDTLPLLPTSRRPSFLASKLFIRSPCEMKQRTDCEWWKCEVWPSMYATPWSEVKLWSPSRDVGCWSQLRCDHDHGQVTQAAVSTRVWLIFTNWLGPRDKHAINTFSHISLF